MRIARYLVAVAQSRKEFMTEKPQQKEKRREEKRWKRNEEERKDYRMSAPHLCISAEVFSLY